MNSAEIPQMAAAGGIVLSSGHALLIRKHGLWDIPKGKTKKKEHPERCALREIAEETGLDRSRLAIRHLLCRTSYISYYSGKPFNKTVTWFLLDYDGSIHEPLSPDTSEDIDLCQWVPIEDLLQTLQSARPYLRSVRRELSHSMHLLTQKKPTAAGMAAS